MTAWQVIVTQTLRNEEDVPVDATYVEYVETLEQASHIVGRFHDYKASGKDEGRFIESILIKQIFVQLNKPD